MTGSAFQVLDVVRRFLSDRKLRRGSGGGGGSGLLRDRATGGLREAEKMVVSERSVGCLKALADSYLSVFRGLTP